MTKTLGPFKMSVEAGKFSPSECIVMLGQNGTGKTTMIKMLAGLLQPDPKTNSDGELELPRLNVSYKPQTIAPKFEGKVEQLFRLKIQESWQSSIFKTEVLNPLNIDALMANDVQNLSGGELQRVAIVLALAKESPHHIASYSRHKPSALRIHSDRQILWAIHNWEVLYLSTIVADQWSITIGWCCSKPPEYREIGPPFRLVI